MSVGNFDELAAHIGHDVRVGTYEDENGTIWNVALECRDCCEVLLDFDREEELRHRVPNLPDEYNKEYYHCPKCKSERICADKFDPEAGRRYVWCDDCNYKWYEFYGVIANFDMDDEFIEPPR